MLESVTGANKKELGFPLRFKNCKGSLILSCELKGSNNFLPTFTKKSLKALAILSSVECSLFLCKTSLPNQELSGAKSELPGETVGVCSFHRRCGQLPYNLPITHLRFTPRSLQLSVFTCAFNK